ncbi:MAG: hypothetical protein K0M69_08800 [Youngiibacter sp.]|nr:hypothetical protein [Youngiibacter sp.]
MPGEGSMDFGGMILFRINIDNARQAAKVPHLAKGLLRLDFDSGAASDI